MISRPYGPGLIEASASRGAYCPMARISRPYGPGLIEAPGRVRACSIVILISRPYGPGLIEALLTTIMSRQSV